jgi:N-acetylmuramoyl-L-alanine amidase
MKTNHIILLLILFLPFPILHADILYFQGAQKTQLTTVKTNGWVYLSLNDLKKIYEITATEEKSAHRFSLELPNHTLTFVEGNPFYLLDGTAKKMNLPFLSTGKKMYISLPDAEQIFRDITDEEVYVMCQLNSIVVGKETFNPDSIIVKEEEHELSFTLTSRSELITSVNDDKKGTLKLTLFNAVCKPTLVPPSDGRGAIKKVLLSQEHDKAILTFFYDAAMVEKIREELVGYGPSIRITFYLSKEKPAPEIKPKEKKVINTIVLDPGHGGRDPGAVGPSGVTESEIVLKIAKELRAILVKKGFRVIMTRNDDSFVRLRDRSHMANNTGAHLFISIHCNGSGVNSEATGFETYYLSTAKTGWARAVEAKENSVIEFEAPEEKESILEYILWDLAQNEHLRESSELAELIQDCMAAKVGIENRGVKQANFHVMREIYMPSVLVETAFITSPKEETKLKTEKFRKELAEGIADGIMEFKEIYEKRLNQ